MSARRSGVHYELQGLLFLVRNVWSARGIGGVPPQCENEIRLRGMQPRDMDALRRLHRDFRAGRDLNAWRRTLYRARGNSLIVVADQHGTLVGFDMYYFREHEHRHGVVHEAFVGVAPEHRSRGLATAMRRHAARHFATQGVRGISTQVHEDNQSSMRSALSAGFVVAERPDDGQGAGSEPFLLMMDLTKLPNELPAGKAEGNS